MNKVITGYITALIFWFIMFSPWTAGSVNFWYLMITACLVLTSISLLLGKANAAQVFSFEPKWIWIGLVSAIILYLVFFVGNEISRLIFDFTDRQVENIYSTKEQGEKILIGIALLFLIGPAEEIFWRGFAQHEIAKKYGEYRAWLINAFIYAFVHIWGFNFMLFMAALICGLFWGWMKLKFKSVVPGIISHALWDVTIFILIPLN